MLYCVFICFITNIFGTLMNVQLATCTTFGCLFKQSARRFYTSCHTCNLLGDCLFKPSDLLYPLRSQPHKFPYTKVPSNSTFGFPFCARNPGRTQFNEYCHPVARLKVPPCQQPTHSMVLSTGLCPCKVHPNPGTHFTAYPRYFGSPQLWFQTPNPDGPEGL